jgi:hypothetical protein
MTFVVTDAVNVKIPSLLKVLLCFLFPATISTVKRSYSADELTCVRLGVLTAVLKKSYNFWNTTPYSQLKVSGRFGGTSGLHLEGSKSRQIKKPIRNLFHTRILHGLFFNPEDRSEIFLWKVGWPSVDYTALYPRGLKVQ